MLRLIVFLIKICCPKLQIFVYCIILQYNLQRKSKNPTELYLQSLDISHFVNTPYFNGSICRAAVQRVSSLSECQTGDGVFVTLEGVKQFQRGGVPNVDQFAIVS